MYVCRSKCLCVFAGLNFFGCQTVMLLFVMFLVQKGSCDECNYIILTCLECHPDHASFSSRCSFYSARPNQILADD